MELGSPLSASVAAGLTFVPQIEQGHVTATETPAPGDSMLPLSSVARVRIVVDGFPWAIHV
jgi:hypothetical protein